MMTYMRLLSTVAAGATVVVAGDNHAALKAFRITSWSDFFRPPCELTRMTAVSWLGKIIQSPTMPAPFGRVNDPSWSQFIPPRVEASAAPIPKALSRIWRKDAFD